MEEHPVAPPGAVHQDMDAQEHADKTEPHEMAPVHKLPDVTLMSVHYPGFVKNTDRALHTLRGEATVSKAFKEKKQFLELRFRPEDTYCHPIFGDYTITSNLLLKVTRKKPSAGAAPQAVQNPTPFQAEIVGRVTATYQFKGMADFQYIPPLPFLEKQLARDAPLSLSEDWDLTGEEPMHLPPPIFSKVDIPQKYRFMPNTLFRPVETRTPDGKVKYEYVRAKVQEPELHQRLNVSYDNTEIPGGPPASVPPPDAETLSQLEKLFADRPIWLNKALEANIPASIIPNLKKALPYVAYYFSNGPWRHTWVRFGYDPRDVQNNQSRIYQVLDFRCKAFATRAHINRTLRQDHKPHRPKKSSVDISLINTTEEQTHNDASPGESRDEHRFLVPPSNQQTLYQLCDIEDEKIQSLVHSTKGLLTAPNRTSGWYPSGALGQIRWLMTEKLPLLLEAYDKAATTPASAPTSEISEEGADENEDAPLSPMNEEQTIEDTLAMTQDLERIGQNLEFLQSLIRESANSVPLMGDDELRPFDLLDTADMEEDEGEMEEEEEDEDEGE